MPNRSHVALSAAALLKDSFEDRAGIALEGWDLRVAERTVRVVGTHSSEKSWTARASAGPGDSRGLR